MKFDYDIVIFGGGMIGAALATQLAPHGFSIALIETQAPQAYDLSQSFDLKVCALSPQSAQLMQQSKAWDILQSMRLCPYQRMRVWEMAGFGDLMFSAHQAGVTELGHIVENRLVQLSLWQALEADQQVEVICPAEPVNFTRNGKLVRIELNTGASISARLVVGADGANSKVRQAFGVGVNRGQYQQACLVASVNTQLGQQDITWQRFVDTGPQAFLPLLGQHGSVVWYHQVDQARALSKLSNSDLGDQIMAHFPAQLGAIEVTAKASFGLQKQHAQSYCAEAMVLLGDAAHVINPLAGQGVNLGFQDVASLSKVLKQARMQGEDWASINVLSRYQKHRKLANSVMLHSMDAFHHGFSHANTKTKWLRNLALSSAKMPLIKRQIVRYAIGL